MNSINIVGRLTRDPEMSVVGDGVERVRFTVASDRYIGKDKDNETDFFNCSLVGKRAAAIKEYFKKGDQIIIQGEMRSYKGNKEDTKDTTYWNVNVDKFAFGAQVKGDKKEAKNPAGFNPEDIPF